jgi:hypothetical protein
VLVWTPAPFYLRNALAPFDQIFIPRPAVGKVRRLGNHPAVIAPASDDVRIEVTVREAESSRAAAPFVDSGGEPALAGRSNETPAVATHPSRVSLESPTAQMIGLLDESDPPVR